MVITETSIVIADLVMQDMQAEKLKEQLRNMLMERKREAKKAFDMAGAWSKGAAARPAGRLAKKGDDSTLKVTSQAEWLLKPKFPMRRGSIGRHDSLCFFAQCTYQQGPPLGSPRSLYTRNFL